MSDQDDFQLSESDHSLLGLDDEPDPLPNAERPDAGDETGVHLPDEAAAAKRGVKRGTKRGRYIRSRAWPLASAFWSVSELVETREDSGHSQRGSRPNSLRVY